jgi:hypothetical protein
MLTWSQTSWVITTMIILVSLVSFSTWFPVHCIYAQIYRVVCGALWQGLAQWAQGLCLSPLMLSWAQSGTFWLGWSHFFWLLHKLFPLIQITGSTGLSALYGHTSVSEASLNHTVQPWLCLHLSLVSWHLATCSHALRLDKTKANSYE